MLKVLFESFFINLFGVFELSGLFLCNPFKKTFLLCFLLLQLICKSLKVFVLERCLNFQMFELVKEFNRFEFEVLEFFHLVKVLLLFEVNDFLIFGGSVFVLLFGF